MKVRSNKTGFKGVTKAGKKWASAVNIMGKSNYTHIYLGVHTTPQEAYKARVQYLDGLK